MDYEMVEVPMETYIKAVKCECGGIYAQRIGDFIYNKDIQGFNTTIAKADFKCNKCGKVITLSKKYFSDITYRTKDNC